MFVEFVGRPPIPMFDHQSSSQSSHNHQHIYKIISEITESYLGVSVQEGISSVQVLIDIDR